MPSDYSQLSGGRERNFSDRRCTRLYVVRPCGPPSHVSIV